MREKKQASVFYTVFTVCFIVLFALLIAAVFILRSYLADFEATRPEHVAQNMFEKYFTDFDALKILRDTNVQAPEFDTLEDMAAKIEENIKGKELSYSPSSVGLDDTKKAYYVKYSDGERDVKVATFTVEKSDKKSSKGFATYELGSIELYCIPIDDVTIKAPTGYTVTVNGKQVGPQYVNGAPIETESCKYMRDGGVGITYTLYTVPGLYKTPEIKVTTPRGEDSIIELKDGVYEALIVYSKELQERFGQRMIDAAKAYATFMQNDCKFRAVDPYFLTGTDIYNQIKTSQNMWVIEHDSYYFENEEASEFYEYADGVYSCRVKLKHVLKRARMADHVDYMDVTYYFIIDYGDGVVYASSNN